MRRLISLSPKTPALAAAILLVTAYTGCGDNRPDRVPIAGRVLIDGQPLTRGNVRFIPADARPSIGAISEQGEFELTCYDGQDGAVPGSHRVEVIAAEEITATQMRWHAPKKYSNFETSDLVIEVSEPRDDLLIELTWDGGSPYVEKFGR